MSYHYIVDGWKRYVGGGRQDTKGEKEAGCESRAGEKRKIEREIMG